MGGKKTVLALLAAGAALTLVGCSGGSPGPTDSADGARRSMVVYGSSGAIEDAMTKDLLPKFEQENNVDVTYVGMAASQALLKSEAMKSSPEASLVIANELVADVGAQEDLWKKLDLSNMPTLASLPDAVIADGSAAATGYWTVGIAYNKDTYAQNNITPPKDWNDLWNPAVAGQVVQYDISWGYTAPFLYAYNQALGGSMSNFQPVMDKMAANKSSFQSIATAAADFDQAFSSGVGWVGVQASMRGGIAAASGVPVAMAYPSSGVPRMITPGMVPANAPQADLGEKLLDYLLTPEAQAIYAGTQYYNPVNPATVVSSDVQQYLPDLSSLKLIDIDWIALNDAVTSTLTDQWQQTVVG